MLLLKTEHAAEIESHGEREFPNECCGLLIGHFDGDGRKTVVETFPIDNAKEVSARYNRSLILPKDLLRGEHYARERKLDVVGNYHSHPDHPAMPSQFDLEHALPVWSYVIVSILKGEAADLRSWEMETDRTKFNAEEIIKED